MATAVGTVPQSQKAAIRQSVTDAPAASAILDSLGELKVNFHAQAAAEMVDQTFWIADDSYEVTAIEFIHAVADSSAGSLDIQVTKDNGTEAPGAGNDLLTNNSSTGFNGLATANTRQTGTLTATAADLKLVAGDRLSIDFEAAATELVGVTITVSLKRTS
jgi:hypothetical protein